MRLVLNENDFKGLLTEIVKEVYNEFRLKSFNDIKSELPDVIRLYHSTDLESLSNILETGVIDARQGRSTGETNNVNWFSTEFLENYGCSVFSIDVPKKYFIERGMTPRFEFMNYTHVTSYDPIDISQFNFQVIQFTPNVNWENLQELLKKYNNDECEVLSLIGRIFDRYGYYCSIPLTYYIVEKLKGKQYLYDYYINVGDV